MRALLVFLLLGISLANGDLDDDGGDDDHDSERHRAAIEAAIFRMTSEEAIAAFGEIKPQFPTPRRQDKVDHFVVLYMENHSADHLFGCMGLKDPQTGDTFDGIPPGGHKVPILGSSILGSVNISCGTANYVCKNGPTYDKFASKFSALDTLLKPYKYPYAKQDDKYSYIHGLEAGSKASAARMFGPAQIPVKAALARSFGVFNKLYTAVPGPSSPNHLFTQSGTSCGMRDNKLYSDCGGPNVSFPQRTIYDSLRLHNVSFSFFLNSTCGLDGKPCHGEDPITDDSASAINTPDVAMAGVARYHDRYFSQDVFYAQAANGTLPAFSWLHPPLQACDHPCHDVAKGERLLKDVYEALRASPKWNRTVLFVAYDDAGGYYDHVVPPYDGVPADEAPCNLHGKCGKLQIPFDFRRLGLRTAAMLISPLVREGAIFQEPKRGPASTSQFELTSVPATVKNLFNLSAFLTKRDAWAGSFDELLLDEPRSGSNMPMHLPDAPAPASPWDPPPGLQLKVNDDDDDDDDDEEEEEEEALSSKKAARKRKQTSAGPGHCSAWDGAKTEEACAGLDHANLKQRRNLQLLSELTGTPMPDIQAMNVAQADMWLGARWSEWMAQQRAARAELVQRYNKREEAAV